MKVSVVVPVFNESRCLRDLLERIDDVLEDYEVIFVDDGSEDDSWAEIRRLSLENDRVVGIRLSQNAGQHQATICGLGFASGSVVVTMDADLQHRPEEIPELIQALSAEADVAIAKFERKMHGSHRNLGSRLKNRFEHALFEIPPGLVMSGFKAMKPEWAARLGAIRAQKPYLPAYLYRWPCRLVNVSVRHDPRMSGRSHYNAFRMASFILSIVLSDRKLALGLSLLGLTLSLTLYWAGCSRVASASLLGTLVWYRESRVSLLASEPGFRVEEVIGYPNAATWPENLVT